MSVSSTYRAAQAAAAGGPPLDGAEAAYQKMMSGAARFRMVLTTG
ncbi:hypothetical protein [Streptomyces sp. NPDC056323]